MKKIFNYIGAFLTAACLFTACQPEENPTIDPTDVPEVSQYESNIDIVVDPETNQTTFRLDGVKGVYPIWIFDGTAYSTVNGLQKIFVNSGDYEVQVKVGNANGISDGTLTKTFHVDNSIVDFTKYYTLLCKDGKQWHIDGESAGHMACGEPGTIGTNWWSAAPGEKKDWGVYDNVLTFTHSDEADTYTFDPGASGTIYVNTGCSLWPEYHADADYTVPVDLQETTYAFEVNGNDLYLVFPENTLFPYIAYDDIYAHPRYRVESITAKTLELVVDNGSIAWHYLLSSGEMKKEFNGFNYKHEANMWKPIDDASAYTIPSMYYAHGSSWEGYPDGSMTYTQEGPEWTINLPYESNDRWQAQFHILPTPGLAVNAATNYDFSCIINSTQDIPGMTIKFTDSTNDGNFLFEQRVDIKAYEEKIFWLADLPGIDAADMKLVFDFGGNPAETVVNISNITLKDHAINDGTEIPEDDPDDPDEPVKPDRGKEGPNQWPDAEVTFDSWYSGADWAGGLIPDFAWADEATHDCKIIVPEGIGGSEWMGQSKFHTNIPAFADKKYNFSFDAMADADMTVTVKLAWEGNDNDHSFFYVNDFALKAYEKVSFDQLGISPDVDYDKVVLFIDLGRSPAGSSIELTNFQFCEVLQGTELWDGSKVSFTYWYSGADWSGALIPEFTWGENNSSMTLIIPEGIGGSEWMGQSHFTLDVPVSAAKTYDFGITINSSTDCTCTVKLAWEGNDNDHAFFYKNDVQLTAFEDVRFEQLGIAPDVDYDKVALFVDLGRTPAQSTVVLSNFNLIEY